MEPVAFEHLGPALHQPRASLPEDRTGKNTRYALKDTALGAFAVVFTQSPSFGAYQRTLQQAKGRRNAESLLRRGASPCETQIRTWLDPVAPAQLFPVFAGVYAALEGAGHGAAGRGFVAQRLIALAGTDSCASPERPCARCSQRPHPHGQVT